MKLVIYSVNEKNPPINEDLILWEMEDNEIIDFKFVRAETAIPEDGEEVPTGLHPTMIWSSGIDMSYNDFWSYSVTSNGE